MPLRPKNFALWAAAAHLALLLAVPGASTARDITTIAGTGAPEDNGTQGQSLKLNINQPFGVEFGPDECLFITDVGNHRVWRMDRRTQEMELVAGSGKKGYSGDGGPATKADLNEPYEVRFDRDGNMYFVEMQNHVVRRVAAKTGIITTIAGTGKKGFSGDGGPAIKATFHQPHSIALSKDAAADQGFLYVADIQNHRIRRIDLKSGIVETIAGNGEKKLPQQGGVALASPVVGPRALFLEGDTLWVALREGHSVWKIDLNDGRWQHVAGTGKVGFHSHPIANSEAAFNGPKGIALGPDGNAYVVDTENQAIRKIDVARGHVETIAGFGSKGRGYAGDGGDATKAKLGRPHGICVGPDGTVYIGDSENHRVRAISAK